ncbi:hypothetical protein JCM10212_007029 [Sporobolomyces blumeae]
MHGLQLPNRPKQPLPPMEASSLPSSPPLIAAASSSSSPPSTTAAFRPAPPPNFALARSQARLKRQQGKSPFVPKKTQQAATHANHYPPSDLPFLPHAPSSSTGTVPVNPNRVGSNAARNGKERDLALCSLEQLEDMREKNERLLASPETFASLPGGDARLRAQQARIETRIRELGDLAHLKRELESTRIDDPASEGPERIKQEDEHDEANGGSSGRPMQEVVENGLDDEAHSPQAKRRIAARIQASNPHAMSLTESLNLQRAAAARDRQTAERRRVKMEIDQNRPEKVGGLLKGALGSHSSLGGFMFAHDSDSEDSLDEAALEDWLNAGRTGVNGELNEEENEQLNPLKTAYMRGWNQAIAEEGGSSLAGS